ncbi:DUF2306 domain-containing protein [Aestuariibacter salexigens]|uniref:DUF2306 domain-containing protein n=1 Tax=Aestuariibacter salexigens TaxID=226010 RepID=UPI000428C826|nr:DUF2306 domain-containing protein [Aestuariibacter salexigens]
MSDTAISTTPAGNPSHTIKSWLSGSVKVWVSAVLIGQWMFGFYILAQFTMPWLMGQLDESQFSHMIRGYKNGESFNNFVLLLHVIPVMVISMSATLQLVPFIRNRYRTFHRWNGRVFLIVGFFGAVSGLYMTWGIGSRLSDIGALGVTLNGLLIPVFVYFAWRTAVYKKFAEHRRYAVHAFILINGVWSVRLYLMAWFMLNQGPLGNTRQIDGPADIAISFASYLLPMAIAELVFRAEKARSSKMILAAAVGVTCMALLTMLGVFAASSMMWIPRISAAF